MRHKKKGRVLGRVRKVRVGLLRSLARSLVLHGKITTTLAKAKELRPYVERMVTLGKKNSVASRRLVSSRLGNSDDATQKIFTDVAPKYTDRAGGYTRITKIGKPGKRHADEAVIEFV